MIPSARQDRSRDSALLRGVPAVVRFLAEAGGAAPSADNSQPWRFAWDKTLDICYRQAGGKQPLLSFDHPATQLALGAVVENLAQATTAIGLPFDGASIVGADQPLLRLTVATGVAVPPDAHLLPLFGRQTNRFPYASAALPASVLEWAREQAEGSSRCLVWNDRKDIRPLSRLVRLASEARFQTQEIHQWLGQSLRFTSDEVRRGDGLDIATLHLPPGGRQMLRLTRDWKRMQLFNRLGAYKGFARAEAAAVTKAPALLGILAPDAPGSAMVAGRLLERVWIELNRLGVAVHPYFVITDQLYRLHRGSVPGHLTASVDRIRTSLDAMLGADARQMLMLLRIGWPKVKPPRAMRLPLGAILATIERRSPGPGF